MKYLKMFNEGFYEEISDEDNLDFDNMEIDFHMIPNFLKSLDYQDGYSPTHDTVFYRKGGKVKVVASIVVYKDEWFRCTLWNLNSTDMSSKGTYKCDQLSGIKKLFKDNGIIK